MVGNVVYLNHPPLDTYGPRTTLDATWALGAFFLGVAAWRSDERRSSPRSESGSGSNISPPGIALVPVAFGSLSLGVLAILVAAHFRSGSAVASGMAIGALGVVIFRMALTLREVRQGSAHFRDAAH